MLSFPIPPESRTELSAHMQNYAAGAARAAYWLDRGQEADLPVWKEWLQDYDHCHKAAIRLAWLLYENPTPDHLSRDHPESQVEDLIQEYYIIYGELSELSVG